MLRDAGFRTFDASRGIVGYNPSMLVKAIGAGTNDAAAVFGAIDPLSADSWDLRMIFSDGF